ncbi:hypothetical protein AURDEDRAFT_177093 [Auricularia subglabra TFB-10046 SS5]|uniref:Uncharacterized protein n=1 Tax=Auricularia subglabra (strain TFB-10046 / SS5) TaxID=717982 RepID=J0LBK8_AURST|nr:hypothetical protein AURDEDRAFT_177093 [Auricularia subglabra TFB-10046 SS5]
MSSILSWISGNMLLFPEDPPERGTSRRRRKLKPSSSTEATPSSTPPSISSALPSTTPSSTSIIPSSPSTSPSSISVATSSDSMTPSSVSIAASSGGRTSPSVSQLFLHPDSPPATPRPPSPSETATPIASAQPPLAAPVPATPAATGRFPVDMPVVRAVQRTTANAILAATVARLESPGGRGISMTPQEVSIVLRDFQNPQTRRQLAHVAAIDDYDCISSGQLVHPWFVRDTNTRQAAAHALRQDSINAMRLSDRLADTVSFFVQVHPEALEGSTVLDVAHEPELHSYQARAIRVASGDQELTYQLMLEAFRHGVAAQHVSDFLSRKEHRAGEQSTYRGRAVLQLLNAHPPRRWVAAPLVVGLTSEDAREVIRADTLARFQARRRYMLQEHVLPPVPKFDIAVRDKAFLRGEQAVAIRSVLLSLEPSCCGLDDWARRFREDYKLNPRIAAELVRAALEDLLATTWPI